MKNRHRTGSALLIVLGMLSFMVVSAVAFSIFMRQGRLPSSFLRQRILARQLVKAGLAHAMSDIDAAIGDDPYPNEYRVPAGGGVGQYLSMMEENKDFFHPIDHGSPRNRNYWRYRVFMGDDNDGYADDDENTHLKSTVSTFPLEGLAYIPPPLVNTVRYWSRRSYAATWKNLDYDSGRYAFTAVNLSDYLDINRLKANVMRDSSPEHRLSLAHLFENVDHSGWGTVKPGDFDKKTKALETSAYGPLVSLADYNMAINEGGPLAGCGFVSQFCKFIETPPKGAEFYTDETQARMQKFITGSWYPGEAAGEGDLVLYDTEQPPFKSTGKGIANLDSGLLALMKNDTVSPVWNKIKGYLNLAERAALRDYVDEDNVPTSLALPTIERTPQLVGLMVKPYGFQPKISELTPPVVETGYGGDPKKRATKRVWKLEGFQNPQAIMNGVTVFPFKRHSGLSGNQNFPVQVLVRAYLVEDGRTFNETRLPMTGTITRPAGANDWSADNGLGSSAVGFISLYGTGWANAVSGTSELASLVEMQPITLKAANADNFVRPLFGWITVEQQDEEGNWSQIPGEEGSHYDTSRFGEVGNGNFYYLDGSDQFRAAGEGASLKWQFFVWVRIMDGNNTADMFPACMLDDVSCNVLNGDLGALRTQIGDATRLPVVPIAGPPAFKLDQATFLNGNGHVSGDGDPGETLVAYCNDPRYNWAPEDWWFVPNGSGVNAQQWLNETRSYRANGDGADYRANDIFQFVSNQGYLQSMGELQFLPLVRKDYNTDFRIGNEIQGSFFRAGNQYDGVKRQTPGSAANQDLFWKSRFGYGKYSDHRESEDHCPYAWGITDRRGGVAVNPYADRDLIMAALANTPYDYIVAAEQEQEADKDLEDHIDLCFNARSNEAKVTWEQMQTIADTLQTEILSKGGDWETEWEESEEWEASDFFGVTLPDFHDVDRKFLFSYWKQCFANNQQLFLIFVRAEPTVIGGSSAGHTPSQLGARAVALVWRDPVGIASSQDQGASGDMSKVHRMRVLFYHQFE